MGVFHIRGDHFILQRLQKDLGIIITGLGFKLRSTTVLLLRHKTCCIMLPMKAPFDKIGMPKSFDWTPGCSWQRIEHNNNSDDAWRAGQGDSVSILITPLSRI